jgi:glycosyltransferase involved in cell wall biosynthesis
MKVLIFSTVYFPLVGGAEVAMKEVTDRISDVEFDLICARVKNGLPSTEKIGNVTVHRCGFGHPVDKYLLPILGPLRAIFLHHRPQLALSEAEGTTDNRPIVWSLMASYGGFAALAYTWLRPKTKFLLTVQEGDPLEHYEKRMGSLNFLHKMVFRRANAVQAISTFLATWAKRMGFAGEPRVIPNGVDIVKFSRMIAEERRSELRTSYGFSDEDVILVTASRLSLKNGIDDLIRSLEFLPAQYKCLIAGEGEDKEKLDALVVEKGLGNRVVFLGNRSHDELPEILQSSDIFVRASLSEGLGNSFLEAMMAGVPVIGTMVGGIPDFLVDGQTGVSCELRNPESIAKAALRIQTEEGLRERIIAQGRELVRTRYHWDGIASGIRFMLQELYR